LFIYARMAQNMRWERLSWITDIAGLIQGRANINWEVVQALASEQRCERVLLLGFTAGA
jgi:hypothetical protein